MQKITGRKAIYLGAAAGLVLSGAVAAYTLSNAQPATAVPDPAQGQRGVLLELNERVLNIQAGPYRYLKIGLTIELRPATAGFYDLSGEARAASEEEALAGYAPAVPLLLDALGTTVSAQDGARLGQLTGRAALKSELLGAFRDVLGEHEVLDVYFTDLVMQ